MSLHPKPNDELPRFSRNSAVALALLCLACLLFRSFYWGTDLHRDMALYAYNSQTLLRGGLPYRDVDTDKPFLVYYLLIPFLQMFGFTSSLGVHISSSLAVVATVVLMFLAGQRVAPGGGLVSAFLFALYSLGIPVESFSPCIEHFMLPFIVASLVLTLDEVNKPVPDVRRVVGAGVLLGLASLVKQSALGLFGATVLALLFVSGGRHFRARVRLVLAFTGGYAAALSIFAGWAMMHGILRDTLEMTTYKLLVYTKNGTFEQFVAEWGKIAQSEVLLWLAPVFGLITLYRTRRPSFILLSIWLGCALVSTCGAGFFFGHHFVLLLPTVCLLTTAAIAPLISPRWRTSPRRSLWACFGVLTALSLGHDLVGLLGPMRESPMAAEERAFGSVFHLGNEVGRYLQSHTQEGDLVYNWGVEWELYFISGRASSTPIINMEPFLFWANTWNPNRIEFNQFFAKKQELLLHDLKTRPPKYFVVTAPFQALKCPEYILPQKLSDFTIAHYRQEVVDGPFYVLRRRDDS